MFGLNSFEIADDHPPVAEGLLLPLRMLRNAQQIPVGSLNHATLDPVGVVQIPNSSCFICPKRSNLTPACSKSRTVAAMSGTCQPRTVPTRAGSSFAMPSRSMMPLASKTSANGRLLAHQAKTQNLTIEFPGAGDINDVDDADDVVPC